MILNIWMIAAEELIELDDDEIEEDD